MKTDLQKVLSISGEQGLYNYISQARSGMIAESLVTKKRGVFGHTSKVSSLSDIAIYTEEGEMPLREVFEKMKAHLREESAPDAKADQKVLVNFFAEVVPGYDSERFYPSHMKKVVQWYNILKEYASLDFVDEEEVNEEAQENE